MKILGFFLTCATASLFSSHLHAESNELVYFSAGSKSGVYREEQVTSGLWKIRSHISDNGRGEDLTAEYQLDGDGFPYRLKITGKSWGGAAVDETFAMDDDSAEWKSLSDSGHVQLDMKAYYLPLEATLFDNANLIRLASKNTDHSVDLLPAGKVTVRRILTEEIDGQPYDLFAISGLRTEDSHIWIDAGGNPAAFIYSKADYFVQEPLHASVGRLADLQTHHTDNIHSSRSEMFRETVDGLVIFRNVKVFDSKTATVSPGQDVLIFDGRITNVRPTGGPLPEGARLIDGRDGVLMPGLWDVHAHTYTEGRMFQHVAFGVTSIREMAATPEKSLDIRRRIDKREIIGPRHVLAGFIEGKSEFSAKTGIIVEDLESAIETVDWFADHDFQQLKIYNSIQPDWVKPMVEHAHERGMRVSGHVPAFMIAEDAIKAGYDEINHINMLFLNFLLEEGDDTRTSLRFTRLGESAGEIDLSSSRVRNFIESLKTNNVAVDPTLGVFKYMLHPERGVIDPNSTFFVDRLPAVLRRQYLTPWLEIAAEDRDAYRRSSTALDEMIVLLHESGIDIMPGTDGGPGYSLHAELVSWVNAGIPAPAVLRAATWVPAELYSVGHERGSIEAGKLADLILVDGDPTRNIEDIRHIRLVMQGSSLFDAPAMLEEMGIEP
jgi:hypothetical protein